MKISRIASQPRKPRKLRTSKICTYTVIVLLWLLQWFNIVHYSSLFQSLFWSTTVSTVVENLQFLMHFLLYDRLMYYILVNKNPYRNNQRLLGLIVRSRYPNRASSHSSGLNCNSFVCCRIWLQCILHKSILSYKKSI